ncbi:MAG: hypothetical protein KC912_13275 [Proteobacteria bacterium]|nr:hypothetical protein [Pseudomonadota bacterium]
MPVVVMFKEGGPFMYLLLLGFPAAALATLVLMVFGAFRFRVPLGIWLAPAFAMLAVGWAGTALGATQALEAMAYVSGEMFVTLSAAGHSVALYTTIMGGFAASLLFILVAASASVGNLVTAGDKKVWTYGQAVFICVLGWTGALAAFGSEFWTSQELMRSLGPLMVAGAAFVATPFLALTSLVTSKRSEDASRLAGGRLVAAAAALLAVGALTVGLYDLGSSHMSGAVAYASAETRLHLLGHADSSRYAALVAGLIATGGVLLASAVAVLPVGGHLGDRRGVVDALSLVVLLPMLGVFGWQQLQIGQVSSVADDRASFSEWAAKTAGLPTMGASGSGTGLCLVRRRGSEWVAKRRFIGRDSADCGPEEAPALLPFSSEALPVIALEASTGIGALVNTQWTTDETTLTLVGAILHPLPPPNPTMRIRWRSTGPRPGEAIAEMGVTETSITYEGTAYTELSDLPYDVEAVFVRPDPRLKVQDLVNACEGQSCVISPAR